MSKKTNGDYSVKDLKSQINDQDLIWVLNTDSTLGEKCLAVSIRCAQILQECLEDIKAGRKTLDSELDLLNAFLKEYGK